MNPSKTTHRAPLLLAILLLPFVVGFDLPDSTGTYIKVSAGRGAYHISGCHRGYDSEILEGNVAMRATLNTEGEGSTFWSRVQPAKTTLGVYGNFTNEKLTLVSTDSGAVAPPGDSVFDDHGLAGGLYLGLDWRWVGLKLGVAGFSVLQQVPDVDRQGGTPVIGLRAGKENLYLSGEVFTASPLYTGGGFWQTGLGGRIGGTRIWGGLGWAPYRTAMITLKGSQSLGPVNLHASGMLGTGEIDPPGLSIDQEYGISVGVEARLPGFGSP